MNVNANLCSYQNVLQGGVPVPSRKAGGLKVGRRPLELCPQPSPAALAAKHGHAAETRRPEHSRHAKVHLTPHEISGYRFSNSIACVKSSHKPAECQQCLLSMSNLLSLQWQNLSPCQSRKSATRLKLQPLYGLSGPLKILSPALLKLQSSMPSSRPFQKPQQP